MRGRSQIGAERVPCLIFRLEAIAVRPSMAESAESDVIHSRVMAKFVTLVIGSARVHCRLLHSRSVVLEKEAVQDHTMVQRETFKIAESRLLLGVRVDHMGRRMDHDPLVASSKNDHTLSELRLQLIKTTNGVQRCDQTLLLLLPSLRFPQEKVVKLHLLLPCLLLQ